LGMALTAIGMPKERLVKAMSSSENPLYAKMGETLGNMVPYEITPQEAALGMVSEIKAFHGSPYKFNKFSNKAIGTGEGAQAFGYGHYVTEAPEVAHHYAGQGGKGITSADLAGRVMVGTKNKESAITELKNRLKLSGETDPTAPFILKINEAIRHIEEDTYTGPRVYETTIHKGKQPSEYTYLEWDKPVKKEIMEKVTSVLPDKPPEIYHNKYTIEQWEATKASILGQKDVKGMKQYPIMSGEELYIKLSNLLGSQKEASSLLSNIGINGNKYPIGSLSGMKGSTKYNYVVFNPEDITIEAVK